MITPKNKLLKDNLLQDKNCRTKYLGKTTEGPTTEGQAIEGPTTEGQAIEGQNSKKQTIAVQLLKKNDLGTNY